MYFDFKSERQAILQEIINIERLGSRIPHLLKNAKQISQTRTILKLIQKHLKELQILQKGEAEELKSVRIQLYSQANTRIKNHVVRKGFQIKQLNQNVQIIPYVNFTLRSLTTVLLNLQSIERQMRKIEKSPLNLSHNKTFHQVYKSESIKE